VPLHRGEQLFGAVRSIRILAGRSFASKGRLRGAIHGVAQYMNDTDVAAGRIEAAFCIHNLCVGHTGRAALTPGGQSGYTDHAGCHQINVFLYCKIT
jgi:hypothetical protein